MYTTFLWKTLWNTQRYGQRFVSIYRGDLVLQRCRERHLQGDWQGAQGLHFRICSSSRASIYCTTVITSLYLGDRWSRHDTHITSWVMPGGNGSHQRQITLNYLLITLSWLILSLFLIPFLATAVAVMHIQSGRLLRSLDLIEEGEWIWSEPGAWKIKM